MRSAAAASRIVGKVAELYPDATTELHYRTPFELLVATILSAQSTDARVNLVTPALFERYPTREALARADARRAGAADRQHRLLPAEEQGAAGHGGDCSSSSTAARCRPTWTR